MNEEQKEASDKVMEDYCKGNIEKPQAILLINKILKTSQNEEGASK